MGMFRIPKENEVKMGLYKKYLKKYRGYFSLAVMFLMFEAAADLFQPLLISKIIDTGIQQGDLKAVGNISLMMFGIAILGLLSALARNYLSTHVSFNFAKDLREALYDKLLKLNMTQVETIERGSMINRLTFDIGQVQMFVNGTMRIFLKAPFLAIGSFIMVLNLDIRFLWLYISILPVMVAVVVINLKYGYPKLAKIQVKLDRLNKKTIEYLNGIRVVKAFNRSAYENKNFDQVSDELQEVSTHAMQFMTLFNPTIMLAANLTIVVLLYLSRDWVQNQDISVGQIVAFINYMTQLMFATSVMTRVFTMYARAKTSSERIEEVFNLEVPDSEVDVAIVHEDLSEGIHIKNLCYRYGEGELTLDNINLHLKSGESLGVIGTTGSGKTTLVHVLVGLLTPTDGQVLVGDKTLTSKNMASLRESIGYVPQDKILFSNTVKENIMFGESTDETLNHIIEQASAEFVYDMTDREESWIGKGGVNISGGQKQRLSLARALMKKPEILILDDSTSALDAVTEKQILDNILMMNPQMMVVVGQKISTVQRMDRILVLDNGKVAGIDTHENLLTSCKPYQEIYAAQMGVNI